MIDDDAIPPDDIDISGLCKIGYHDSCAGYTGPESDPELCECPCHEPGAS